MADLECSICSPRQVEEITYGGFLDGDDTDVSFENQRWIFRICDSFCRKVYNGCGNDNDAAILGANNLGSSTQFCESINGQNLVSDVKNTTGIFHGAQWLVSQFHCFNGYQTNIISDAEGVCLTPFTDLFLPEEVVSSAPIYQVFASIVLVVCVVLAFSI